MNQSDISTWNQTQGKLKDLVFRYTKDRAVADDIVQDVFLKVYANRSQLRETDKMPQWMFRLTRNAIMDHFRKESRSIPPGAFDYEADHKALNECASQCVKEMLYTLPEKYRQALELAELDNVPQLELAQRLGISYSGAKSRVQRARQMLKEKVESNYKIEMDAYGNVVTCENKGPCNCSETASETLVPACR